MSKNLTSLTVIQLQAIAREISSCKGFSAYKRKADLISFIKKCKKARLFASALSAPCR